MDRELLKGLALVASVVVAVRAVFVSGSRPGPQKADRIARALKSGVDHARVDKACHLAERATSAALT